MTARVTLIGHNHTHAPPTSSLHAERASPPLLPMDDDPTGMNALRGMVNGIKYGVLLIAVIGLCAYVIAQGWHL